MNEFNRIIIFCMYTQMSEISLAAFIYRLFRHCICSNARREIFMKYSVKCRYINPESAEFLKIY